MIARVVEYTDIFTEEAGNLPDIRRLISRINRKELVTLTSNMMNKLSNKPFYNSNRKSADDPEDYISFFLSYRNADFILDVIDRYHQLEDKCRMQGYTGPLYATCPAAVLLFMRYFFSIPPCKDEITSVMEIDFFKALLLVNQEVNESTVIDSDDALPLDLQMANLVLGYNFANEGCENENYNDLFRRQVTRFSELYKFLHRQKRLKPMREKFREFYGLRSIAYYLTPHTVMDHMSKGKSSRFEFKKVNNLGKINRRIIRLSSIPYDTVIDFDKNQDYSIFRSRPFIQLDRTKYAFISIQFVMEHIYESLYFQLKQYYRLAYFKSANDFRRYYTTDFAQDWMLDKFMTMCLSPNADVVLPDSVSSQMINDNNWKGIQPPDYYVREDNNIFLFELKSTLASAQTKDKRNAKAFFEDLYSRFFEKDKKNPKAIRQLSSSLKAIQEGKFLIDKHASKQSIIYPLLVVDSSYFTMRSVHTKLEYWMRKYFSKNGIDGSRVKPLILMDISTLRLNCSVFRQKGFAKVFENYYRDIEWKTNPCQERLLNSLKSFTEFMAEQPVTDINTVCRQVLGEINRAYKWQ